MDMMEMRFRMMAMLGGSSMVGDLTKYAEVKVTPSVGTYIEIQHNLGIVPKYVEITCADDSHAKTNDSFIYYGLLGQKIGVCEGVYYNQTSPMQRVFFCDATFTTVSALGVEHYYFSGTTVTVKYRNGAYGWDTNTEYTVKVYA